MSEADHQEVEIKISRPTNPTELCDVLASDPNAVVIAGGTDLMVAVNYRRERADHFVSVDRIPELQRWWVSEDFYEVGAALTFHAIQRSLLGEAYPGLRQAADTVGSPPIRVKATVGGNLATGSPAGDSIPMLMALGARVQVIGSSGERELSVAEFIVGPKRNALLPGEIIRSVRIPRQVTRQEYLKVGTRNAMVIAIASVAVVVDREARNLRCTLGSVGPTCIRAHEAERFLERSLDWTRPHRDHSIFERFGQLAGAAARPIDDHRSSARYRRHAVHVCAIRAVQRALA